MRTTAPEFKITNPGTTLTGDLVPGEIPQFRSQSYLQTPLPILHLIHSRCRQAGNKIYGPIKQVGHNLMKHFVNFRVTPGSVQGRARDGSIKNTRA